MKSDRSWHASISAPDGWGPGPWDPMYWEGTWRDRVDQYGNLRSWPS